ncbi:MAG: phage envelope protein, partial [Pseudopedobacter saltans]
MFTLEQIEKAHAAVKSGADFPQYIKEIKLLGVNSFETFVKDSKTIYYGPENYTITSESQYQDLTI